MVGAKTLVASIVISGLLFLGAFLSVAYLIHVRSETEKNTCVQIEKLKKGIRTVFERSQKTAATSPYYVVHPDKLKAAKRVNTEYIKIFKAGGC